MNKISPILSILIICFSLLGIYSCSDTDEETGVPPGIYQTSIPIYADESVDLNEKSRGIDTLNGLFSDTYPYKEIYLHSADNSTTNHKVLRIPIDRVESCKDCRGINLEMEVKDDGGYIIRTRTGESIELSAKESVYFSSIDKTYWEAIVSDKDLPFNEGHEIYIEDNSVNQELLRSYVNKRTNEYNYTLDDLEYLLFRKKYPIDMSRHCEGFRMFVMFSDVNISGGNKYKMNEDVFKAYLDSLGIAKLSTNIYLGPYFCPKYDMLNMESLTTDSYKLGGYYSSDNQIYRDFTNVSYSHTGGNESVECQGFGFQTKIGKFLLAPIIPTNNDFASNKISVTCFVEATYKDGTKALKSFTMEVPGIKYEKEMTRMHFVVMVFDYKDLKVFAKDQVNSTRSTSDKEEYEEINLKPLRIFYKHQ